MFNIIVVKYNNSVIVGLGFRSCIRGIFSPMFDHRKVQGSSGVYSKYIEYVILGLVTILLLLLLLLTNFHDYFVCSMTNFTVTNRKVPSNLLQCYISVIRVRR